MTNYMPLMEKHNYMVQVQISTNLSLPEQNLHYNVPHWKFGLEYTLSSAWYGSLNTSSGKIKDTHAVCNNRIVAVAMFMF